MTDDALIRAEHLDVGYGDVGIIQDLTFAVRRGAVSALMGRNGVGKTTLVKTLIGLLKPSRGELYYKNENITRLPPYVRSRNGIGYVPQGRQIFPRLTVAENLKTGVRTTRRGIPQAVYEYFPVLWEMRGRLGGDLSGGQQQQLAIGRAIVTDPELLILDEPTEGIQPNIIQRIGEVLRILAEVSGVTILIVEQYLDFIREYSSDFKILNRGAIVASGQTDELTAEHVAQFLHL